MSEDKKLTNDVKDELLNNDKLDNVAGGAALTEDEAQKFARMQKEGPLLPIEAGLGDNRDINPACMSAAFINGDITGGEDF